MILPVVLLACPGWFNQFNLGSFIRVRLLGAVPSQLAPTTFHETASVGHLLVAGITRIDGNSRVLFALRIVDSEFTFFELGS